MGFNVIEDENWVRQYEATSKKIEELLGQELEGELLNNGKFQFCDWNFEDRKRLSKGIELSLAGLFEGV